MAQNQFKKYKVSPGRKKYQIWINSYLVSQFFILLPHDSGVALKTTVIRVSKCEELLSLNKKHRSFFCFTLKGVLKVQENGFEVCPCHLSSRELNNLYSKECNILYIKTW